VTGCGCWIPGCCTEPLPESRSAAPPTPGDLTRTLAHRCVSIATARAHVHRHTIETENAISAGDLASAEMNIKHVKNHEIEIRDQIAKLQQNLRDRDAAIGAEIDRLNAAIAEGDPGLVATLVKADRQRTAYEAELRRLRADVLATSYDD
jgi:hypothetical protein